MENEEQVVPGWHQHCATHEDTRDRIASLAGQMRMLIAVVGGSCSILVGILGYVLLHGSNLDLRVATTVTGIGKNRVAIIDLRKDVDDHEVRIRHMEYLGSKGSQ